MRIHSLLLLTVAPLLATVAAADDWPTYNHDMARSATTAEPLPAALEQSWVYESPSRPQPAWDEPAKWDGWAKIHGLKNRRVFDKALHVAAFGDAVYFGSSIEDKLVCLDAETGSVRWVYYTEGPIRLAPTIANEKVYFGSDDGFAYCLRASDGQLVWKHRPGPMDRRVPGNGRMISAWPVRTSLVVSNGVAFSSAGVIPSERVYLCALDAENGKPLWSVSMQDLPAEGYMLASDSRLYVTTARNRPVVFDRATGKRLYQVEGGGGGTYALLTGDMLLYGPGKTGELAAFTAEKKDHLASFEGNHMIVRGAMSFLHTDTHLTALDRGKYVELFAQRRTLTSRKGELAEQLKKAKDDAATELKTQIGRLNEEIKKLTGELRQCFKWQVPCNESLSLILAGDSLVAGGSDRFSAIDAETGKQLLQKPVPGDVHGLALANGRLLVSTDRGAIHCFAHPQSPTVPQSHSPTVPQSHGPTVRRSHSPTVNTPAEAPDAIRQVNGPFTEFTAPGVVQVTWQTDQPSTSRLLFGKSAKSLKEFKPDGSQGLATQHTITVEPVERQTIYTYQVAGRTHDGREILTDPYEFDSHYEYLPAVTGQRPSPYPADAFTPRYESAARQMIDAAGTTRGYALVLGSDDGRLAYHLARASDLKVIVVEPDEENVRRCRTALDQAGLYGTRVSVHHGSLDSLPYGPYFANLIVSDRALRGGQLPGSIASLYHVLRPAGGVIYLGTWDADDAKPLTDAAVQQWLGDADLAEGTSRFDERQGRFWVHRRGKLPRAGEWTHLYGHPDNSSCSKDELVRGELTVQWWGRPGARPMPDRGNRNPAPVSAAGRLYVQGNRTLFGLDAYNGAILWAKQIPTMRRANMPRDGSNMAATDDRLYVAMGQYCIGFDGQTGRRALNLRVPRTTEQKPFDWGYLAAVGDLLVGTGVKPGAHYLADDGEWYEGFQPNHIGRVTGDFLFGMDRHTGKIEWMYDQGVVMNSTITISDGHIFFVESNSDAAKNSETSRLVGEVQSDQQLVSMRLDNGQVRWRRPADFSQCQYMTYMVHGDKTVLVSGSDKDKQFHTYAFDAESGSELWQHDAMDQKGHHTGELSHPTIVDGHVYFNKHTYDLRSGKVLDVHDFNWHGCGVMSASQHTLFRRYEFHGMEDLETRERTELLGIRGGCWLSLIPSGGLVLAPESGAGCACAHAIQTSIAYVPKATALPAKVEKK